MFKMLAGGISSGVQNAVCAMSPFASKLNFTASFLPVKRHAKPDKFGNLPGGILGQGLYRSCVTQTGPRHKGIYLMGMSRIALPYGRRHPTLGVASIAFFELAFSNNEAALTTFGGGQRHAKTGYPAANNDIVILLHILILAYLSYTITSYSHNHNNYT